MQYVYSLPSRLHWKEAKGSVELKVISTSPLGILLLGPLVMVVSGGLPTAKLMLFELDPAKALVFLNSATSE